MFELGRKGAFKEAAPYVNWLERFSQISLEILWLLFFPFMFLFEVLICLTDIYTGD